MQLNLRGKLARPIAHQSPLKDLAVFAMFFSVPFALSAFPLAGYAVQALFPMCVFLLSFRRAIVLSLLVSTMEILKVLYLNPFLAIATFGLNMLLLPGTIVGIWVFKKLQDRHLIAALVAYYGVMFLIMCATVSVAVIAAMIWFIVPIMRQAYEAQMSQPQLSNPQLDNPVISVVKQAYAQYPILSQSAQQVTAAGTQIASLPPNVIVPLLLLFPLAVFGFLVGCFIIECYVLRSIQRRTRGLPLSFPT